MKQTIVAIRGQEAAGKTMLEAQMRQGLSAYWQAPRLNTMSLSNTIFATTEPFQAVRHGGIPLLTIAERAIEDNYFEVLDRGF